MDAVKNRSTIDVPRGTEPATDKPRRLGRGLSSLVGAEPVHVEVPLPNRSHTYVAEFQLPAPTPAKSDNPHVSGPGIVMVAVGVVDPSPFQPRRVMDDAALAGLADSIKHSGVLQPVLVRAVGGRYELIAGERRWRAAKLAGLETIPALVKTFSDEAAAELALVENVQREDLNPMERAWALQALSDKFGQTQAQLAQRLGMDRSSIANLLRLTELEPAITSLIVQGKLGAGHGKALLAIAAGEGRVKLAQKAAAEGMSVRELERLGRETPPHGVTGLQAARPGPSDPKQEARLAVLADLQRQIGQQLGTKVAIVTDRRGKKGRITLEFYGLDHFDSLLARLGVKAG